MSRTTAIRRAGAGAALSRRPVRALAAGLALGLMALAGCSAAVPEVEAEPTPSQPQPALDVGRLDRVLEQVQEAITAGDESGDAEALQPRLAGAALETRAAEYRLAEVTQETAMPYAPQPLTTSPQATIVSNSGTWPKTILVVTEIPDGATTPVLLALRQEDPRSEYQLLSWVRQLPSTTTPETATPDVGSGEVSPDAEGYVMTPRDAVAAYAQVVSSADSQAQASFAEDDFSGALRQEAASLQEGVADAGSYETNVRAATDVTPVSMATADGGALVFGAIESQNRYRSAEGRTLSVSGDVARFTGADSLDVGTSVTATYFMPVALYVPPAGDAQIQVLGAERVLTDVASE